MQPSLYSILTENFRSKKLKLRLSLILAALYIASLILCRTLFADSYPANWIGEHYFLFVWVLSLLFVYINFPVTAVASTAGCLLGIPISTLAGSLINSHYTGLIDAGADPSLYYAYLYHSQDVFIWLECTLIATGAGLLTDIIFHRMRRKHIQAAEAA